MRTILILITVLTIAGCSRQSEPEIGSVASASHAAKDDAWANPIKAIAPAGIKIIKIKQLDYGLLVSGNADSNARVSEFMRNIHDNKLGTPLLDLIQIKDGVHFFVMRIKK
ncbi:MAG TPA: hypothetical protein ENG78_03870 [Acidiferrobacteraceae bacterium]|nr:hypothetical protein [Acidiferrobacteraceae bacterium]HEX19939.1 hypothetical protein [Acidiferrobacteraceae bacterium]